MVFGILSQLEEGKYYLEDPSGILPINLSQTVSFASRLNRLFSDLSIVILFSFFFLNSLEHVYHDGLFTENCLVLAEGVFNDDILFVHGIALPPPETSKISRYVF